MFLLLQEKFSDVVNWLKANAAKEESLDKLRSNDSQIKPPPDIEKNSHKLFLDKPMFPATATASFGTSFSRGIFSNSSSPFAFGGILVDTTVAHFIHIFPFTED